ncbi:MAG TPA: histidinol dehydrogenase [Saprospiraceae bacterium]|nr:histidinol dehydrogenase [Saprospiraceae bacterium]
MYSILSTYQNPGVEVVSTLIQRPQMDFAEIQHLIEDIFNKVENQGDRALEHYSELYEGFRPEEIKLRLQEMKSIGEFIRPDLKQSILQAAKNIRVFHEAQISDRIERETMPGVRCWMEERPIEKVGLYIPGGSAPLFSTVLMLAIPAIIAGCKEIVLCSPPQKEYGTIHPAVLYSAQICGVTTFCQVGGAQAIAAMSTGTESVPKVDKIFGPGNQYVTAAKRYAFLKGIAIDMPAGPSELLVFADETSQPAFVAADLLSQAEHGEDSQVVLVSTDDKRSHEIQQELEKQLLTLPRKQIAAESLKKSFAVIINDLNEAFHFINRYAPEHLILATDQAESLLDKVENAGSVFVGHYTPESAGDYASGTNHTLPTSAAARAFSGVNLQSFTKKISFQQINRQGLQGLAKTITTMAREEHLEAHARAIDIRISSLKHLSQ